MTLKEFIRKLESYLQMIEDMSGIPWQVIIAQAVLETRWLEDPVVDIYTGQSSYNLFNIKGKGPAGSVKAYDIEYVRGTPRKVIAEFRAYNNYIQSFEDYVRLLTENKRYIPKNSLGLYKNLF